jgi:hypothetical protein
MAVKAIPISDKSFFWRCDCGWESERLSVGSENVSLQLHNCRHENEFHSKQPSTEASRLLGRD